MVALDEARAIHASIIDMGYDGNKPIANALVNVYGKCQSVDDGLATFHSVVDRDVVTWTSAIAMLSRNCYPEAAMALFRRMASQGVLPNAITLVCVLDAYKPPSLSYGQHIHAASIFQIDVLLGNALIGFYGRCRRPDRAERVFFAQMCVRDVVSCNAMISTYSHNGCAFGALRLFERMLVDSSLVVVGMMIDRVTLVCALDACARLPDLVQGRKLHDLIVKAGCEHLNLLGSALITLYAACNAVVEAADTFDRINPLRDLVSWNAMIHAYATNACATDALRLFARMLRLDGGLQPDRASFCGVLRACTDLACIDEGKELHSVIDQAGFGRDLVIGTALLDMYAKCGSLAEAKAIFRKLALPNVVAWTAMIEALSHNGDGTGAWALFEEMQTAVVGIEPGLITFASLLNACTRVGSVEPALHYFASMKLEHGLEHTSDHYVPTIDVLARAGRLVEAEALILEAPIREAGISWECLLGACRIHRDLVRGTRAAMHCFELEPRKAAPLIALDNIYAEAMQS